MTDPSRTSRNELPAGAIIDGMTMQPAQPPPPPGWQPRGVPPTSGQAIGSLLCGLAGPFTGGVLSVVAIVLGAAANREIRAGERRGRGLALAGIVLGWLSLVPWAAVWLLWRFGPFFAGQA